MKTPIKRATRRLVASAALAISMSCAYSAETTCDIVIYGSSPAAISAAVQAKRMGKSAVVVSPESRIGGLTTGGLADPHWSNFTGD